MNHFHRIWGKIVFKIPPFFSLFLKILITFLFSPIQTNSSTNHLSKTTSVLCVRKIRHDKKGENVKWVSWWQKGPCQWEWRRHLPSAFWSLARWILMQLCSLERSQTGDYYRLGFETAWLFTVCKCWTLANWIKLSNVQIPSN